MDMAINTNLVRQLRSKANWSQEDLAAASGLSIRTIQRVENDGKAGLETRRALAAAFGVAAKDLDLDAWAYQPGEMAAGTGLLLIWVGVAWFFNLGLGIGLIGVGVIYVVGQLVRLSLLNMPILWELVATGLVCLMAGVAAVSGMEVRLGAVVLIAFGCGILLRRRKA